MTAVVVPAIVVTAMVVTAMVVTAVLVIVARDLLDAVGHSGLERVAGKSGCSHEQRGDDCKGHWAFHLWSP
jgi:hypothetical protein